MTSLVHIGIACAYHLEYEIVTVVNFAAEIKHKSPQSKNQRSAAYLQLLKTQPELANHFVSRGRLPLSDTSSPYHLKAFKNQPTFSKDSTDQDEKELEDEEWPEGAVSLKENKFEDIKGGKRIVKVVRKFKMEDGSVLTKEFQTVEKLK